MTHEGPAVEQGRRKPSLGSDVVDVMFNFVMNLWPDNKFVNTNIRPWPLSFIPHCRDDSPLASVTPVIIGKSADALPSADVLINLGSEPPAVFSRFDRLMEIVTEEENDILNGRQRYRFYKDRGYELVNHDLRGSNR